MLGALSRASNKGYIQLYGKYSSTVTEWGLYEGFRVWGQRSEAAVNDARLAWGARARSSLNQIWRVFQKKGGPRYIPRYILVFLSQNPDQDP